MNLLNKKKYLCFTICIFISFLIGYIHYSCFFPLSFNGDAAAHHVLAKAMLDEGSFLPKDFAYGNQLIFWRSSPFIAFAMAIGLKGCSAFILGSSLSVAFWGGILYLILAEITGSGFKTVILSGCILVPLGYWEMNFILGMQSHLANAVLSLACFVLLWKYIQQSFELKYLIFSNVCFFLITMEAPIRGLLIVLPMYIVAVITVRRFDREFLKISCTLIGSFFGAFFLNKLFLHYYPLRIDHFRILKFRPVGEIVANLGIRLVETMHAVSNLYVFSNESISFYKGCLYIIGLLIIFIYLAAILAGGVRLKQLAEIKLVNALQKRSANTHVGCSDFLLLGGVAGCCIGALAVAALNPDSSRHYLWAVFLIKVAILLKGYSAVDLHFSSKVTVSFFITFFLIASWWHAVLIKYDGPIMYNKYISLSNNDVLPMVLGSDMDQLLRVKKIAEETGIHNVYGEDFWRMMPINTVLDNINAQALIYDGHRLVPYVWLTRPSWGSVSDNATVLYFLKQGKVDKIIEERLLQNNGLKIFSDAKFSIWKGPRVWDYAPHSGYYEKHIDFNGDKFKSLPTQVGDKVGKSISTNGKTGFLFYGPYVPVQKGLYKLSVFGNIKKASGSYIEIVSQKGTKTHIKIPLQESENGVIITGENIEFLADLEDVEIRVWVADKDELEVSGYRLMPVSSI